MPHISYNLTQYFQVRCEFVTPYTSDNVAYNIEQLFVITYHFEKTMNIRKSLCNMYGTYRSKSQLLSAASAFKLQHNILIACNFRFSNQCSPDSVRVSRQNHFKMMAYTQYSCAVLCCTYCVIKYSELHSHKIQFNLNLNQFRGIKHSQSGDCVVANKTQSIRTVPWFEFHSEKENKTNSKRIRFNCVTLFSLFVCVSFILIFFNIKPYFCVRYSEVYCRKKKNCVHIFGILATKILLVVLLRCFLYHILID